MLKYSVAIRTLGTSQYTLKRELESIHKQTVLPEKIIIYIADGYKIPDFRVGFEEYVYVAKGMVRQRALKYDEIESEYILMLDDDVELSPNSMEKILQQMVISNADCMAIDIFKNHKMTFASKTKAVISNWVFPRFNQKWGIKLHRYGSFSYINNPRNDFYPSMSGAGPASFWKKNKFLEMKYDVETWLDDIGFAYGEDDLMFYKLHINKGKLYMSFNHGMINLDGGTASSIYKKDSNRLYIRSFSNYIRWYRMFFEPSSKINKIKAYILFTLKLLWLYGIHLGLSCFKFSSKPIKLYYHGIRDGRGFIKSNKYKSLSSYKMQRYL